MFIVKELKRISSLIKSNDNQFWKSFMHLFSEAYAKKYGNDVELLVKGNLTWVKEPADIIDGYTRQHATIVPNKINIKKIDLEFIDKFSLNTILNEIKNTQLIQKQDNFVEHIMDKNDPLNKELGIYLRKGFTCILNLHGSNDSDFNSIDYKYVIKNIPVYFSGKMQGNNVILDKKAFNKSKIENKILDQIDEYEQYNH